MISTPTFWIIFVFSLFYTLSLTVKIAVHGFERFWNKKPILHRFDFFNVYALIIVEFVTILGVRNKTMDKAIILLSMARMLRLGQYLTPLAHLFKVIKRLMPTYMAMCRLLMIVYFIFVVIGRMAFGGQIYNTNPVLAGSSFAHNHFWTMNFNDCCSGLVTLVVLNILMALILDCMGVMSDAIDKEDANENDLDGDFEKDAAGGGEKSAVAMLRMVLSSDKHEDSHEEPSGAGGSGYGTFGTAVSDPGPKVKRAMSIDDIDLEHHGDTQSKLQQALHGKSKTFEDVDVHVLEAATAESDKYKETEAAAKVQSLLR